MNDEITPASILEDWLVSKDFDATDLVDGYVRCAHCRGKQCLHSGARGAGWKLEHNYSGAYRLVLRHARHGADLTKINHQRFNEHRHCGVELELCLVPAGSPKPSDALA